MFFTIFFLYQGWKLAKKLGALSYFECSYKLPETCKELLNAVALAVSGFPFSPSMEEIGITHHTLCYYKLYNLISMIVVSMILCIVIQSLICLHFIFRTPDDPYTWSKRRICIYYQY